MHRFKLCGVLVNNNDIVLFSDDNDCNIKLSNAFRDFYRCIEVIMPLGGSVKEVVESRKYSLCE